MRLRQVLFLVAMYLVAFFAIVAGSGCNSVAETGKTGVIASGALSQDLDTIKSEAGAAKPHADPIGQTHLESLLTAVASAASKMVPINAALAAYQTIENENEQMKASFLSYRQKHDFWYTVGAIAIAVGVLAALYFFTSFADPIGKLAYWAFHILTGGIFWVGGKFSAWVKSLSAKTSSA